MITIEFPDDREKFIGLAETAIGVGLMLGPFLGGILYHNLGYEWTFYIFALMIFFGGVNCFIWLPNRLNKNDGKSGRVTARSSIISLGIVPEIDEDEEEAERPGRVKITNLLFFKHKRSAFCLIACSMCMIFLLFFESILSTELDSVYHLKADVSAYIFAIPCFFYAVSSLVVSSLTKCMPRRFLVFLAFVINVIALLMFGPSALLGFPYPSLGLLISGLALNGVCIGFIFTPLLPEILYVVAKEEGLTKDDHLLNDTASGLYNVAYSSGTIIATILGGALNDAVGFRYTCDIMALMSACFTVIFFFGNVGIDVFKNFGPDPKIEDLEPTETEERLIKNGKKKADDQNSEREDGGLINQSTKQGEITQD